MSRFFKPCDLRQSFNKLALMALVGLILGLSSSLVQAQTFQEGVHYTVINQEATQAPTNEVVEYFSFSCPGCFAVEPSMTVLEQSADDVNVRRVHMPFGGPKAKYSQKVYALMQLLDADQHKAAVFNRIHKQRNTFDNDDEIVEFFVELGYDEQKTEQMLASFSADSLVRKMNKEAAKNKVASVPTIIVNGRYQVSTAQLADATTLSKIVRYLNALPKS